MSHAHDGPVGSREKGPGEWTTGDEPVTGPQVSYLATLVHQAGRDVLAATYEPKRLRLRILAVAGRIVRTARRRLLKIDPAWPWADVITNGRRRSPYGGYETLRFRWPSRLTMSPSGVAHL